jgi:hypothetical protein
MAREISRRTLLVGGGIGAAVSAVGVPLAFKAGLDADDPNPAGGQAAGGGFPGGAGTSGDLGATPSTGASSGPVATPPAGTEPVSMAMHIHGSFSEGRASMAAHLSEATKNNVDVIWWTDHDFRINALGYQTAVGFDGPQENQGEIWWKWTSATAGAPIRGQGQFVSDPHSPHEAGKALRLTGVNDQAQDGELWYVASAWNLHYRTSLAETTLSLDLLGIDVGPDARLAIQLTTSYHPAGQLPAGMRTLRYEFGGVSARRVRTDGLAATIALPLAQGSWQTVSLRPVQDIATVFPDILPNDNSMFELRVGVLSRNGSTATGVFDRLRINRSSREAAAAMTLRDELIAAYRKRYPKVIQFSALEVSLTRHLNWFGGDLGIPTYPSGQVIQDTSVAAAKAMATYIKSRGGVASYNHPLPGGANPGRALGAELIAENALGCDIVEIGYGADLNQMLLAFDAAARNGVFFTATGVTDDHEGNDWIGQGANYITSVWARNAGIAELSAQVRAGRAWFVNPAVWRGTMDLRLAGASTSVMGGVICRAAARVDLAAVATDVPNGSILEIVIGRVDYAGAGQPVPAIVETRPVAASRLRAGAVGFTVDSGSGAYVRLQLRSAAGTVIGVSNPLWLLPEPPARGIPGHRRLSV